MKCSTSRYIDWHARSTYVSLLTSQTNTMAHNMRGMATIDHTCIHAHSNAPVSSAMSVDTHTQIQHSKLKLQTLPQTHLQSQQYKYTGPRKVTIYTYVRCNAPRVGSRRIAETCKVAWFLSGMRKWKWQVPTNWSLSKFGHKPELHLHSFVTRVHILYIPPVKNICASRNIPKMCHFIPFFGHVISQSTSSLTTIINLFISVCPYTPKVIIIIALNMQTTHQ